MNSSREFEDLVTPGVLPGVKLPGPAGHVVDLDGVEVVVTGEGVLVVLRLGVVVGCVNCCPVFDFAIDGKNHRIGAVLIHSVPPECLAHVVERCHVGRWNAGRRNIDVDWNVWWWNNWLLGRLLGWSLLWLTSTLLRLDLGLSW